MQKNTFKLFKNSIFIDYILIGNYDSKFKLKFKLIIKKLQKF